MPDAIKVYLPILAFAVFFPVFWLGVVWLISRLGGWNSLARGYAARNPPEGETFGWTSGKFSFFSSYNNCLNVSVSDRGVYVVPNAIFKFGHVPLFFPWAAMVRLVQRRVLFSDISALHIDTPDGFHPVTLYGRRLSAAIARHAPAHLTAPPVPPQDRRAD